MTFCNTTLLYYPLNTVKGHPGTRWKRGPQHREGVIDVSCLECNLKYKRFNLFHDIQPEVSFQFGLK